MGRKKNSGAGTIYRTKHGWRGQIVLGGERFNVSGKTKGEVSHALAEIRVDFARGEFSPDSDITIQEWVTLWLDRDVRPRLTDQSFIKVEGNFKNHIFPAIGDVKLTELDKPTLEKMYAEVFQGKTGKKYKDTTYAHETVNAIAVQLKKSLSVAVQEGILKRNPHEGVQLHKLRPPKKINAYSLEDQKKIIEYTKNGKKTDRIFYFLISTGMRFGEAAAITWDDVDLKKKSIKINKTAISLHGSMFIQDHPKTDNGNRTIYVADNVVSFLKQQKEDLDTDLNYRNLVFPNSRYNIINTSNALMHWKKICAALDIESTGMHTLRHTWATRALEKGIDVKTVSDMLGHKNVITTMNIYQDVLPDQKIKAAKKMNDLF
ncbi:MAG: tyrosine-type recombinase/integrase [Bacillota bacterium]|nr:tyrosine-type recombinase/integrase [Bacillota bacterium]